MSLDTINKDDDGYVIELTYIDTDTDAAADISAYTSAQYIVLKDPGGNEAEKSASFKTDGSDGVVQYTVAAGDIGSSGEWSIRIKVESGSSTIRSEWESFNVGT